MTILEKLFPKHKTIYFKLHVYWSIRLK